MTKKEHIHHFLFIGGLHRSGTTILANTLAEHPNVSSFKNTGFPKDEGQFLQSVFPPAKQFGGPGVFGFSEEMHLTEKSHYVHDENKKTLIREWSIHWDLSKKVLLEKSPPNILKSRFLQAIFPSSAFVFIMRHPIAVAYSTQKWSKTTIPELLSHWVKCHRIMLEDTKHLKNFMIIRYEDFVQDRFSVTEKILKKVELSSPHDIVINIKNNTNEKYLEQWKKDLSSGSDFDKQELETLLALDLQIQPFGYTIFDPA